MGCASPVISAATAIGQALMLGPLVRHASVSRQRLRPRDFVKRARVTRSALCSAFTHAPRESRQQPPACPRVATCPSGEARVADAGRAHTVTHRPRLESHGSCVLTGNGASQWLAFDVGGRDRFERVLGPVPPAAAWCRPDATTYSSNTRGVRATGAGREPPSCSRRAPGFRHPVPFQLLRNGRLEPPGVSAALAVAAPAALPRAAGRSSDRSNPRRPDPAILAGRR